MAKGHARNRGLVRRQCVVRTRTVSGITNFLNYCDIFTVYKLANVAAGRGLETDDLGVQICLLQYARGRFQWPRGLRRGSAASRLLGLRVRIPPGAWMSVCCECCVLSGRALWDGLITRTGESYRL